MSEEGWKGPWRCKECGWYSFVKRVPHGWNDGPPSQLVCHLCSGELVPWERRAPDPEKAELVAALRAALASKLTERYNDGLHEKGCNSKKDWKVESNPCDCAWGKAQALLRRIEEEP